MGRLATLYSRHVFPWFLDKAMGLPAMGAARQELLAGVAGRVLEIGFGTGRNLPFYNPGQIERLLTVDVNPGVHRLAEQRLANSPIVVEHQVLSGEALPMPDQSFDAVVSTFTLCSIPDVASALREVRRVLKPGGRFFFLEHGRSPDPALARWQQRLTPVQKVIGDGCHLDRDMTALVRAAGFRIERLREFEMDGVPRVGAHMFLGIARPVATS